MLLWEKLQPIRLTNAIVTISWSPTARGSYSACSPYEVQFSPRLERPDLTRLCQIKAEGRESFFSVAAVAK